MVWYTPFDTTGFGLRPPLVVRSTWMIGERRRCGASRAPVLWGHARSVVDLGGGWLRRKDLDRHNFRSAAPPRHTNCFAMFFCSDETQPCSAFFDREAKSAERTVSARHATRERAVDMTAAQPLRNFPLSAMDDEPLSARRRRLHLH